MILFLVTDHRLRLFDALIRIVLLEERKSEKGRTPMHHPSLETLASHLSEQLRCTQEDLCRQIISQVARGKPVAPPTLQSSLQISQHE